MPDELVCKKNDAKNKKHPVRSAVGGNSLFILELRGERSDRFKLTGSLDKLNSHSLQLW